MEQLTKDRMLLALYHLGKLLPTSTTLIVGGGGAMVLAHGFPLGTYDIDAIPKDGNVVALDPFVKQVATKLGIPGDWLNPWFSTFTHTLPIDYGTRLIEVFNQGSLIALALGKDDMLVMKCFAHRQKDFAHAKALIKAGADLEFVRVHIESLRKKKIPGCDKALDFLDDVEDSL